MKLHPEDPRLTAYLLGELPADEATAVEHAIAADPALQLAIKELEDVQAILVNTLAPDKQSLLPRQRDHILSAARHADASGKVTQLASHRRPLKSLLVPLAAAAIIALAVFLMTRLPSGTDSRISTKSTDPDKVPSNGEITLQVALLPAPGPPDAASSGDSTARPTASSTLTSQAAARDAAMQQNGDLFLRKIAERLSNSPAPEPADLPNLETRGSVSAAQHPSLPLPVHAGRSSLGWISLAIRDGRKLPPANAVRIEEMLNQFSLRPTGAAAIANGVTLSTEALSCPWKPSATLLLVSIRGATHASREVTATFQANASAVRRYRLIGFSPVSDLASGPLPTHLPPKEITSLLIEIEPASASGDFGSIEWTVNGEAAPPVTLARNNAAEPSDDARFAALVATFGQWLTKDPAAIIDADLLTALARETVSDTLAADRADFLNLIDQAIHR